MWRKIYLVVVAVLATSWYVSLWKIIGNSILNLGAFFFVIAFFFTFWFAGGILSDQTDSASLLVRKTLGILFFILQAMYLIADPSTPLGQLILFIVLSSWSGVFGLWIYKIIRVCFK